MFQSVTIKNFRCFQDFTLGSQDEPLARINLIAGKNNTGKTALLEAIRLHCDPTDSLLPTDINQGRGIEDRTEVFAELWTWLFLDRDRGRPIELNSQDDEGNTHTVTL